MSDSDIARHLKLWWADIAAPQQGLPVEAGWETILSTEDDGPSDSKNQLYDDAPHALLYHLWRQPLMRPYVEGWLSDNEGKTLNKKTVKSLMHRISEVGGQYILGITLATIQRTVTDGVPGYMDDTYQEDFSESDDDAPVVSKKIKKTPTAAVGSRTSAA